MGKRERERGREGEGKRGSEAEEGQEGGGWERGTEFKVSHVYLVVVYNQDGWCPNRITCVLSSQSCQ